MQGTGTLCVKAPITKPGETTWWSGRHCNKQWPHWKCWTGRWAVWCCHQHAEDITPKLILYLGDTRGKAVLWKQAEMGLQEKGLEAAGGWDGVERCSLAVRVSWLLSQGANSCSRRSRLPRSRASWNSRDGSSCGTSTSLLNQCCSAVADSSTQASECSGVLYWEFRAGAI